MSADHRKRMHINSLAAYWALERDLFSRREKDILLAIRAQGKATDREVMLALNFSDMNSCRPRITELVKDGVLEEVGTRADPVTGKTVRIVSLKADPRRPQAQFDLIFERKTS